MKQIIVKINQVHLVLINFTLIILYLFSLSGFQVIVSTQLKQTDNLVLLHLNVVVTLYDTKRSRRF